MKAVAAGVDNLIKCEDFAREQVKETTQEGGGGVNSSEMKWKRGELEFEAYMRLLDSMVCSSTASSVKPTFVEYCINYLVEYVSVLHCIHIYIFI